MEIYTQNVFFYFVIVKKRIIVNIFHQVFILSFSIRDLIKYFLLSLSHTFIDIIKLNFFLQMNLSLAKNA